MDALCVLPFNDARECLFKADGNVYNCKGKFKIFDIKEWLNYYVHC